MTDALDLADLRPGERFVDLGCGDGQVLLEAAGRGAVVSGVESDDQLAAEADANLRAAGVDADIATADLLDRTTPIDADVVFTYLAPATLQRLLPRLRQHRGTRLVTVDFAVPGLVADAVAGRAHLYRMPGRRRRVRRSGWPSGGTLIAAPAGHTSLTVLEVVHPAGATQLGLTGTIRRRATVLAGADDLDRCAHLAVDVRVEVAEAGTVAAGAITTARLDPHPIVVVWTDEDEGLWELTTASADAVRRALRRRRPPATLAALLDAATS